MKKLSRWELSLPILLFSNMAVDIFAAWLLTQPDNNTVLLYSIWYPLECAVVLFIYNKLQLLQQNKALIFGVVFIPVFSILNLCFIQGPQQFNSLSMFISGLLVFIFSYMMLRKTIVLSSFQKQQPMHWLFAANTIYNGIVIQSMAGVMALLAFGKNDVAEAFYRLNSFGYAAWSILLTLGIYSKNGK